MLPGTDKVLYLTIAIQAVLVFVHLFFGNMLTATPDFGGAHGLLPEPLYNLLTLKVDYHSQR